MPLDPGIDLDPPEASHGASPYTWGGGVLQPGWWGPSPRRGSSRSQPSRRDYVDSPGSITLDGNADVVVSEEAAIEQTEGGGPRPEPKTDDDNTMWWILGGVGVVAALGITAAVVVAGKPKRRRRTTTRRRRR